MKRWTVLITLVLAAALASGVMVWFERFPEPAAAQALETAPEPTPGPVQIIETKELMKLLVDPQYVILRNTLRNVPDERAEWRALYVAAYTMAEVNNLLFSRRDRDYMGTDEWNALSVEARERTISLGEAVKKQDYELIKQKYLAVIDSCNQCHTKYDPDGQNAKPVDPGL